MCMYIFFLDPDVKFWVLASIDDTFDVYIALAENLSILFIAMNDPVFEIREQAVKTIARLSTINPACILPSLRKTLLQVIFNHILYVCYCKS